jgi:hypothetical protein
MDKPYMQGIEITRKDTPILYLQFQKTASNPPHFSYWISPPVSYRDSSLVSDNEENPSLDITLVGSTTLSAFKELILDVKAKSKPESPITSIKNNCETVISSKEQKEVLNQLELNDVAIIPELVNEPK